MTNIPLTQFKPAATASAKNARADAIAELAEHWAKLPAARFKGARDLIENLPGKFREQRMPRAFWEQQLRVVLSMKTAVRLRNRRRRAC